jgi:hypothetical protein
MTISPVTFVTAPPIRAVEKVQRVTRRPRSPSKREEAEAADELEPLQPSHSAEEMVSDGTRDALLGMKLGG